LNDRKTTGKPITVTQWRTPDDLLCPVKIWASITNRILSYEGANENSPVSLAKYKHNIINVTAEMTDDVCRDGVVAIGERKLGILRSDIRTGTLRSRAAMAMCLAGVLVFSIMLVGRWSSKAFLKYIRKQVQEFLHGISSKMMEIQSFEHIRNPTETNPMENIVGGLVFFADGMKLAEEASSPKGRGRGRTN
jgi:hypothetical protein